MARGQGPPRRKAIRQGSGAKRRGGSRYAKTNRNPGTKRWIPGVSRTGGLGVSRFNGPHAEMKYFDLAKSVNDDAVVAATESDFSSLHLVQKGSDADQRIGRQITIRSVNVRLQVDSARTSHAIMGQVVLVLDKQANGTQPTAAEIWENPTSGSISFRNMENTQRFVILHKQNIHLSPQALSCTQNQAKVLSFTKNLNLKIQFGKNSETAITDIPTNNLTLWFMENSAGPTFYMTRTYKVRIRYTDN